MDNMLSVITINRNNSIGLKRTIESVLSQTNKLFDFIVIDGNSTDNSLDIITNIKDNLYYYVSENDNGIYDAMNKGIQHSRTEWIILMNSGDIFYDEYVIEKFYKIIESNEVDCIYSDCLYTNNVLDVSDIKKIHITHQALFYKKELHKHFGLYYVGKKITISDYLFFNQIKNCVWYKTDDIIAICESDGTSSNNRHYYQKLAVDIMYNNIHNYKIAIMLIIFPSYKHFWLFFAKLRFLRSSRKIHNSEGNEV